MPSRRTQIAMTDEEVDAYLAGRRTMNVATVGPSGHPHLVAMWYGFVEGRPAFWTFAKSQKMMNLRRDPKLTALVESGDVYAELRGVEIVGTGRIVDDRATIIEIGRSVAERYTGPVDEQGLAGIERQADKRHGVIIDIDHIVSWDHTKLAGRY
jgi:PPOX class probable F420-dependent enzyme